MRKGILVVGVLLVLAAAVGGLRVLKNAESARDAASAPERTTRGAVSEAYGRVPLHFEANRGQTDERVKFLTRGRGYTMFLAATEAVLVLSRSESRERTDRLSLRGEPDARREVKRTVLRMTFPGASSRPLVEGREHMPGRANYFIGNDSRKWRTNVPTYARVHYQDLYPGIDLVYYGNQRALEYDLIVRPGADPTRIALGFEGVDRMEVDTQGDLVLHTALGTLRQRKPVIYQEVKGVRREIAGGYVLNEKGRVGLVVAGYDTSQPLVIDPALFYSTYLGGSQSEESSGIAVDAAGNAYVTGFTGSPDFPTTVGAFQTAFGSALGSSDAFVTKLNPTGSALVYSTYLGGSGREQGLGIAVDGAGNAYITGFTLSTNFPTTVGAFQTTTNAGARSDAFVTKLNPTGSALVYSTYLGGSDQDVGRGIAVDGAGNAHVTGETLSPDFPTTPGAFQAVKNVSGDAFATKLDPTGSALVYSTHIGGSGQEGGNGIAIDAAGSAHVIGFGNSTDFPTTSGAFDATFNGGFEDAFVTKLDPTGSMLVYSTYLGGSDLEVGRGIAVDAAGNAYVTGFTVSANFPTTPGAFQPTFIGGGFVGQGDAFVAKLDLIGSALVYSTYLGGGSHDESSAIAIDGTGNAYLTGFTFSTDFPTTVGAFQTANGSSGDGFVTKLDAGGATLVYSSYLGGSNSPFVDVGDWGLGIALDALPSPNAYVTGLTGSTDFPTTAGAFDTTFNGETQDGFIAQITDVVLPPEEPAARVTGGGTIDVVEGIANFHFIVQRQTDGTLSGRLQYFNHATDAKVQSQMITSLTIAANVATFDGTCTLDGMPCTFTVDVTDNGEPGTTDTFTISVSSGPPEGGVLRSGNILIREQ